MSSCTYVEIQTSEKPEYIIYYILYIFAYRLYEKKKKTENTNKQKITTQPPETETKLIILATIKQQCVPYL